MRNETPVTVVGTLVRTDGGRRVGEDQALVRNLRVAANERRFDRESGSWVDGETLYLSVNCWRALAEHVAALAVGDPVIATGRLRTREWTNEQGERRSVTDLDASAVGPDLARCAVSGVHKVRREPRVPESGAAEPGAPDAAAEPDAGHQPGDDADQADRADQAQREDASAALNHAARPLTATGA